MVPHLILLGLLGEQSAVEPPIVLVDARNSVGNLIRRALLRIGAIAARTSMSPQQLSDGMDVFIEIIHEIPHAWTDVVASDGYVAAEDQRVFYTNAQTVYKPTYINTCDDTGTDTYGDEYDTRTPRDGAKVQFVNSQTRATQTWLFRADRNQWVDIEALVSTDPMPFSNDLEGLVVARLAVRLAEDYGVEPPATLMVQAAQWATAMRYRTQNSKSVEYEYF